MYIVAFHHAMNHVLTFFQGTPKLILLIQKLNRFFLALKTGVLV